MAAVQVALLERTLLPEAPAESPRQALHNLAHELRQPLSTIEAMAYYLEMTLPADQIDTRQYLCRMQQLIEQANGILNRAVRSVAGPAGGTA